MDKDHISDLFHPISESSPATGSRFASAWSVLWMLFLKFSAILWVGAECVKLFWLLLMWESYVTASRCIIVCSSFALQSRLYQFMSGHVNAKHSLSQYNRNWKRKEIIDLFILSTWTASKSPITVFFLFFFSKLMVLGPLFLSLSSSNMRN